MAKTIQVNATLSANGDGIAASLSANTTATQVGNNAGVQVFTTSNSGALVPVGGLSTYGGYFMLKNLDAEITIGIYQDGATATVKICDLLPGQVALFPPAAALGCKAASGTPDLAILACEP